MSWLNMDKEKKVLPGDMLTGQEQLLIGGTVHETDNFWHIPQGVVSGEYSVDETIVARKEQDHIWASIGRQVETDTPIYIRVTVPLEPLDPVTGETINDPSVTGIHKIWSPAGEFQLVERNEVLTQQMYAYRGGEEALHIRRRT